MIIKQAEYVTSAVRPAQYPSERLPEIALAGRSNVGKSSLINKCVNRKNMARTSGKPGKTQTLNFYRVRCGDTRFEAFYFVDLPGYGFAQVSQATRERWARFMQQYLGCSEMLRGVIQLVDLRHPPSREDALMYERLCRLRLPVLVVATKCDKVARGKWQRQVKEIRAGLAAEAAQEILVFSAETGEGLERLRQWVEAYAAGSAAEA